jgi:subfamily B ATP-binding cassette protein MsbA
VSKASDTGGSLRLYRRLLGYALPYKGRFVIAAIGMIVLSLTSAAFAAMMKPLVDHGFVGKDMDTIRLFPRSSSACSLRAVSPISWRSIP